MQIFMYICTYILHADVPDMCCFMHACCLETDLLSPNTPPLSPPPPTHLLPAPPCRQAPGTHCERKRTHGRPRQERVSTSLLPVAARVRQYLFGPAHANYLRIRLYDLPQNLGDHTAVPFRRTGVVLYSHSFSPLVWKQESKKKSHFVITQSPVLP